MSKRDLLWILFFAPIVFFLNMVINPVIQDSKKTIQETERILHEIERHTEKTTHDEGYRAYMKE